MQDNQTTTKPRFSSKNRSSSSKLDRIETTQQTTSIHYSEREIYYDLDREELNMAETVLSFLHDGRHPETIERFRNCSTDTYLYYDQDTSRIISRSSHCHIRWCPICATKRARFISGITYDWLMAAREPSFITLTLAHIAGESLAAMLGRLHSAFKIFRRDKQIKQSVFGGIWFLQVKRGRDSEWHAHLHIAADSSFIPKERLSEIWLKCTGDSKIIDIQRIREKSKMAAYVARYVSKPCELKELSFSDAIEVVETLRGKRLFGKWGNAAQLQFKPQEKEQQNLIPIASLSIIAKLHRNGISQVATNIYRALHTGEPIDKEQIEALTVFLHEPPWPPD